MNPNMESNKDRLLEIELYHLAMKMLEIDGKHNPDFDIISYNHLLIKLDEWRDFFRSRLEN